MSFDPYRTCPKCDNPLKVEKAGNQTTYRCIWCQKIFVGEVYQRKSRYKSRFKRKYM